MRTIFPSILLLISGFLLSCLRDKPESFPENLEWNPELAFPIGIDRFGLNAKSGFDTTLFELDTLTGLPEWADPEVELLMTGKVKFDLSAFEASNENINRVLFRVSLHNGFPHEVMAQAYFRDEAAIVIDSMFSEGAIPVPAGVPLRDERIIDPSVLIGDAVFEDDRIEELHRAIEIVLKASIINPEIDTTLFDYYRSYYIDLELGIMTNLTILF